MQRRLAWFKELRLYKRVCDLCKKEKISMYPPEAQYTVYCPECWWGDGWNPQEYAREYDFSKPFFEQFNEQMHRVPLMGLAIGTNTLQNSPFTNHCDNSKNCYLIYYSDYCEDTQYGFYLARDKSLLDCTIVWECGESYDSMNIFRSSRVHGSRSNVHDSLDCYLIKDCKNGQDCFGSCNLRNKKYVFFNEQLTKEEYKERMSKIDLGSYKTYEEMRAQSEEVWKKSIPHPAYDYVMTENCTGSYVFYSKNCKECYDLGYCENCKYIMLIKNPSVKDSYDYIDWGEGAERIYEGITVGDQVADVRFSQDIHSSHNVEYSKSCMGSANLFGCIGIRNKEYCIFNKQYDKETFDAMRKKIIAQMKGEYGEFFPMTLSPHAYNDTFAHMFFPLTKEAVVGNGLHWFESPVHEYQTTLNADQLPDHIRDATDEILKEVIKCMTCSRGYRVTQHEFQFLKHYNFPLPRRCPFCRIEEKLKIWVRQMTLIDRICDKCGVAFRIPYTKEYAPVVYCKKCYFAEVI